MGFWSWARDKIIKKPTVTTKPLPPAEVVGKDSRGKPAPVVGDTPSGYVNKGPTPTQGTTTVTYGRGGGGGSSRKIITPEGTTYNQTPEQAQAGENLPPAQANRLEPNTTSSNEFTQSQNLPVASDDSDRMVAPRPYDVKANTPFIEKLGGAFYDYTIGLPGMVKLSLQKTFGVGGQGLDPIGGFTNLFSPFDRFGSENRVGNMPIGVDQGTGVYNPDTRRFEPNLPTGFDKMDEISIANPDVLLTPKIAYQKDYEEKAKATADELRPGYELQANNLAKKYQEGIDSGKYTQPQAQKLYETDIGNLNTQFQGDVFNNTFLYPQDSAMYQASIDFRKDYNSFAKDFSIKPSTLIGAGVLIGATSGGGMGAVAVNTAIGLQGFSTVTSSIPDFGAGNYKSGAIKLGVGSLMAIGGTYGAFKTAGNMITQQQIADVTGKKAGTTFSRTSFDKYNFQDDFSSSARTSNAYVKRWGSSRYIYDPSTKTYSVTGGQTNKIITTDYWTGKQLTITNYQTFSGVGEQVGSGTITGNWAGGSITNPNIGGTSRIKEILTRVEFDTSYTYSNLGGSSSKIVMGGKSGGQTYQSFVISNKAGKVLSITGNADNIYMATAGTKQLQTFTTASGVQFKVQTSSYSKFPQSSIGKMDSLAVGFVEKSEAQMLYNSKYPASGFGTTLGKAQPQPPVYDFKPFANTGLSARFYTGTQLQYQLPSIYNQPVASQGVLQTAQPIQYSQAFMQQTPLTMLSTTPQIAQGSFATLAPTLVLGNSLLPSQTKDLTKVTGASILVDRLQPVTLTGVSTKIAPAYATGTTTIPAQIIPEVIVPSVPGGFDSGGTGLGVGVGGFGWIPPFDLGSPGFGSGSKNVPFKQTFKYTPDYTSLVMGRRGKQGKSIFNTQTYAGFESRPITKDWGKMFSSALGIFKKKKKSKKK